MAKLAFPEGYTFEGFDLPHYTPVPDVVFDYFLPRLGGAELKVLLYIIRRTLGFKKNTDDISLKQLVSGITTRDGRVLDEGTGLSKPTVVKAAQSLADKGIIIARRNQSEEKGDEATTYILNFRREPVLNCLTRGSQNTLQGGVKKPNPQETEKQVTDKQHVVVTLTQRGVHVGTAQRLASKFPDKHIREKIAFHDWLREHNPKQLSRSPTGWLIRAIEKDYAPPHNFGKKTGTEPEEKDLSAWKVEGEPDEIRQTNLDKKPRTPALPPGVSEQMMDWWEQGRQELRLQLLQETFNNWLRDARVLGGQKTEDSVTLRIGVRNFHARNWLEQRLKKVVDRTLSCVAKCSVDVRFEELIADRTHFVRRRRQELGLSQNDLVLRLQNQGIKISRTTISTWECGKRNPRLDDAHLNALAAALEWNHSQLIGAMSR
jgi:DNA-binding XRE family transcriptional regulator